MAAPLATRNRLSLRSLVVMLWPLLQLSHLGCAEASLRTTEYRFTEGQRKSSFAFTPAAMEYRASVHTAKIAREKCNQSLFLQMEDKFKSIERAAHKERYNSYDIQIQSGGSAAYLSYHSPEGRYVRRLALEMNVLYGAAQDLCLPKAAR